MLVKCGNMSRWTCQKEIDDIYYSKNLEIDEKFLSVYNGSLLLYEENERFPRCQIVQLENTKEKTEQIEKSDSLWTSI